MQSPAAWVPAPLNADLATDMLPPEICGRTPAALQLGAGEDVMSLPLRDARESFEKEYLTAQITRFNGNISRTAGFIGMERSALHRKLKSLGVQYGEKGWSEGEASSDKKENSDNVASKSR